MEEVQWNSIYKINGLEQSKNGQSSTLPRNSQLITKCFKLEKIKTVKVTFYKGVNIKNNFNIKKLSYILKVAAFNKIILSFDTSTKILIFLNIISQWWGAVGKSTNITTILLNITSQPTGYIYIYIFILI